MATGAANSLWRFFAISLKNREFEPFEARKTLWQTTAPGKTRGKKVPQTGSCTPWRRCSAFKRAKRRNETPG
jgi:hypothetical protein